MFMPRRRSSNAYDAKDVDAALESFSPVRKAQKAESGFSAIVRTRSDVLPSVSQRQLQRKRTSEVDVGFALARDEHKRKNRRIDLTGLARVLGNRSYEDDRVLLNPGKISKNNDFQKHQLELKYMEDQREQEEEAEKHNVAAVASQASSTHKMMRVQSQDGSSKDVAAIIKAPYIRPSHSKIMCPHCSEYPDGFRGEHELRRHTERAHALIRKMWVTVDASPDKKFLANCKQCRSGKKYGAYYNAAAHLRRAHFRPQKLGRKGKHNKKPGREGGDDDPRMDLLKQKWMKEVETVNYVAQFAPELVANPDDSLNTSQFDAQQSYDEELYERKLESKLLKSQKERDEEVARIKHEEKLYARSAAPTTNNSRASSIRRPSINGAVKALCIKHTISEDMTKGEQARNKARFSAIADRPRIFKDRSGFSVSSLEMGSPGPSYQTYENQSPSGITTPTSATFSAGTSSPRSPSGQQLPISTVPRSLPRGSRTPGRQLSVPSGTNPFQGPQGSSTFPPPYISPLPSSTSSIFSQNNSLFAGPISSIFTESRRDSNAAEADRRRRTWRPGTYTSLGPRPATSGLSY